MIIAIIGRQRYSPLLFNLSMLFDFNPVRGDVKSMHTTVKDNTGTVTNKVALKLIPIAVFTNPQTSMAKPGIKKCLFLLLT